jgi:hypothetical protein|eukprot:COSAG06_NODE_1254_length_10093_cov_2.384231_6_plen_107_part_00
MERVERVERVDGAHRGHDAFGDHVTAEASLRVARPHIEHQRQDIGCERGCVRVKEGGRQIQECHCGRRWAVGGRWRLGKGGAEKFAATHHRPSRWTCPKESMPFSS